jgi:hypothetical protein
MSRSNRTALQLSLPEFTCLCSTLDDKYGKSISITYMRDGEIHEITKPGVVKFDVLKVERTPQKLVVMVELDHKQYAQVDLTELRTDKSKAA